MIPHPLIVTLPHYRSFHTACWLFWICTGWSEGVRNEENKIKAHVGSEEEGRQVQKILEQIVQLFAQAEQVPSRYKSKKSIPDDAIYDPGADLDPILKGLHNKMHQLALKRQKRTSIAKKTAWALYEKNRLSSSKTSQDTLIIWTSFFQLLGHKWTNCTKNMQKHSVKIFNLSKLWKTPSVTAILPLMRSLRPTWD